MPRHITAVPIRWSDVDQLGHVNNVAFLRYLQEARVGLLFVRAAEHGAVDLIRGMVVHRHEIAYLEPLSPRLAPSVRVETWVRRINAASFELGYEVLDMVDGPRPVLAVASSVLVPYDLSAERPRRVGQAERALLEHYVDEGPEVDGGPSGVGRRDEAGGGEPCVAECAVRFDDLDSYGHVNNVMIAEYLQQARIDFFQRHVAQARAAHEGAVAVRHSIDYLAPIPFRVEPLQVGTWVSQVGTSSIGFVHEVRDSETVFARAWTTIVAYDTSAGRKRPLTDAERVVLKEFCQR